MTKRKKKNLYLVATKAMTINLFFKYFISKNKNFFNINVICSDPKNLKINTKINKIKISFPTKLIDFLRPDKLFLLFNQLSSIKNRLINSIILLNTPVASHFFRIRFFLYKLNIIYFVHGFRFIPNGSWYKNFLFETFEKILSIPTKKYITINSFDYNFVKKNLKYNECLKINGIGVKIQKKNNFKYQKNKLKILVISAYKKEKGYKDLIEVAKFFNKKNYNISFTCYGYGDYKVYQSLIAKNKLKNIFLRKFNKNLNNKIKNYSLLFHPSFREGLPVSVMQSLSNGIPVIARDVRGCNDLIKNNLNGYLFHKNKDVIKQISRLYNNEKKISEMSYRAFESINFKYSNKYISKKITNFINERN